MSQGLLLLSALLATSCKESSNNFFVPDHEAPSLVSVTPANGETAEENNTILLTFNEYVKAGEGKANFNGEEVELTFKGKTRLTLILLWTIIRSVSSASPKVQS